jgi:hypothetical protein
MVRVYRIYGTRPRRIVVSGSGEREWMAIISLDAQKAVNGGEPFNLAE